MLTIVKAVTLTGQSMIDGTAAESYQAVINSSNPDDMTITSWQTDKTLYKAHRAECRNDKAVFEDAAYALQDEMLEEGDE